MPRWVGGLLGAVLACACGDDSSAGGGALRVEAVAPADGATEVDIEAPVVVSFNRDVDPSSADSIEIVGVASDIEIDGATVTLSPREPYGYLEEFEVVVPLGVHDLEGGQLAAEHRSSFTTRFRRWEMRRYLGDGAVGDTIFGSRAPDVAGLPDGRVVALWQHGSDGALEVSWSVYQPDDDAWSPPARLGQSTKGMEPQLESNGLDAIVAVWIDETSVMSARYDPANDAFEAADPVHVDEGFVFSPAVAVSPNGDAAVAFDTSTGIRVHRRSAGGAWSGDPVGQGTEPAVAIADDGTVWAAWLDGDGVIARVFDGLAWGDPAPLWSDAEATVYRVRLARWPSNGGAIATWGVTFPDSAEVHVRAHQFGDWSGDEIIGMVSTPDFPTPAIATGTSGEVLVVWNQASDLHLRWWREGSWQPVMTFADASPPAHPIALDGEGNAIILYTRGASYYQAATDSWIESDLPFDADLSRSAFAGPDPVMIGEQPTSDLPHVVASRYR